MELTYQTTVLLLAVSLLPKTMHKFSLLHHCPYVSFKGHTHILTVTHVTRTRVSDGIAYPSSPEQGESREYGRPSGRGACFHEIRHTGSDWDGCTVRQRCTRIATMLQQTRRKRCRCDLVSEIAYLFILADRRYQFLELYDALWKGI